MSLLKIPVKNALKSRRVPNAFMLYVKEQKKELVKAFPEENKSVIGAFLGKKWRSLGTEEKQVYFEKYDALRKLDIDNSAIDMKTDKHLEKKDNSQMDEISDIYSGEGIETEKEGDEAIADEPEAKKFKGDEEPKKAVNKKNPFKGFFKQKPKKKVRRPPNPFMIFAKEKRNNIPLADLTDKKCHVSTILGTMWRELPDDQKSKYIEEAQRQYDLQIVSESGTSSAKTNCKKNLQKKSAGRPPKKQKQLVAAHIPILRSMANEDSEKKLEGSAHSNDHTLKMENTGNSSESSGLPENQVSSDFSNVSYHQTNSTRPHFHHLPSAIDSLQSKNCSCWNSVHHLHSDYKSSDIFMRQYPLPDGAMARPCGTGAGFAPPFFMPYPMSSSQFWMYYQMMQQMYLQNFPQPYCCGFPYNYYRNTYMPYVPMRSSIPPQPTFPAPSVNFSNGNNSAETTVNESNSEDELLVVDEDRSNHPSVNSTDH